MDYIELNLLEMLDTYGEDKLQAVLSRFMCPQNTDVEDFIQAKAVTFARQRLAMTYLVYSASQFVQFGQRERDTDEIAESPILVQMLKYFHD